MKYIFPIQSIKLSLFLRTLFILKELIKLSKTSFFLCWILLLVELLLFWDSNSSTFILFKIFELLIILIDFKIDSNLLLLFAFLIPWFIESTSSINLLILPSIWSRSFSIKKELSGFWLGGEKHTGLERGLVIVCLEIEIFLLGFTLHLNLFLFKLFILILKELLSVHINSASNIWLIFFLSKSELLPFLSFNI